MATFSILFDSLLAFEVLIWTLCVYRMYVREKDELKGNLIFPN